MVKAFFIVAVLFFLQGCSYLQSEIGTRMQARQFVVDKKWVRNTLSADHLGFRHPHRMTPIVTDTMIIQGNGLDGLAAYDRESGHELWRIHIKGGVEAGAVLAGQNLFFGGSDGFFYSVNSQNGEIKWQFPVRAEVLSRPTLLQNKVYFIAGNNRLFSLAAEDGKLLWSYSRQEGSILSIRGGSQPTISHNKLFLGFSDGFLVALNIKDGSVVWEKSLNQNRRFKDIDAQPVIEGDRLYISGFDDGLYCLNAESGGVIWQHREGGYSAVTLSAERIYYSTTDGTVLALDKPSGKVIWRYSVERGLSTQPQLYRGLIVFGEYEGDLKILEAESGKEIGRFSPGRGIMSSPYVDPKSGDVYFISVNANLFALRMSWRRSAERWPWL